MEPAVIAGIAAVILLLLIGAVLLIQRHRRQGTLKVTSGSATDAAQGPPPAADGPGAAQGSGAP